jgi:sirohydrochlorin cobaltochelatase
MRNDGRIIRKTHEIRFIIHHSSFRIFSYLFHMSPAGSPSPVGVVLLGHGSQEPGTADEMRDLRDQLGASLPDHRVAHAFLNQDPRLESAVEKLIAEGCGAIRVLPLLVFTGRHMSKDAPAEIERLRARHPSVRIDLEPYLFRLPGFSALLAKAACNPESRP